MNIDIEEVEIKPTFVDNIFGCWFEGGITYSDIIKECFWHEDGFINSRKEVSLF